MRMFVVGDIAVRLEAELYSAGFTADVVQDSRLAAWLAAKVIATSR